MAFTHRIDRETYNEHLKLEVGGPCNCIPRFFGARLSIKISSGDNFIKILKLMCVRPDWPEGVESKWIQMGECRSTRKDYLSTSQPKKQKRDHTFTQ